MKRIALVAGAALTICLALSGCTTEAQKVNAEIADLGEITYESYATLEDINNRYAALDHAEKQKVENYAALDAANERMDEILYAKLSETLESARKHAESFFAQYYDMKAIAAATEAAQTALDSSDSDKYYECLTTLEKEVASFTAFIDAEKANSFSVQTNEGDYPYAIEESDMSFGVILDPAVKHSSEYPYNVAFIDGDTTDDPIVMHFEIGEDSECAYDVEVTQIDDIWIDVEMPDGTLRKAFVNTKLVLSDAHNNWGQENNLYPLGEGSCYLFQSETGVILAVEDLVSNSGYLMYAFW